jgi:hypothetical protein
VQKKKKALHHECPSIFAPKQQVEGAQGKKEIDPSSLVHTAYVGNFLNHKRFFV